MARSPRDLKLEGTLTACHLGPIGYPEGVRLQEALVRARAERRTGDWLLFADHPPVLTVGRGAGPDGIRADDAMLARRGVERFDCSRGGDVTWHGPGQLVGYPIVHLDAHGRDLHRYLRGIEQTLICALAYFGLEANVSAGRTGVWIGEEKIASIGIAVRSWVTYHGFALNVDPDLSYFDLIHPCGLRGVHMTSLAAQLGPAAPRMAEAREAVAREVAEWLGRRLLWASPSTARAEAAEGAAQAEAAAGATPVREMVSAGEGA